MAAGSPCAGGGSLGLPSRTGEETLLSGFFPPAELIRVPRNGISVHSGVREALGGWLSQVSDQDPQ